MARTRGLDPIHPGEVLKDIWDDIGMTQGAFAEALGVSRKSVVELLACRRNISADMAHRLALSIGGSPRIWMNIQQTYDLWVAEKANRRKYAKIERMSAAVTVG